MAFAGIFQPFARLRWIRFGLLMRAVNSRAAFRSANLPSPTEGLAASAEPYARNGRDLAPRPRLRVTRSEIAIHEFGRHRHHDQSKNPAHHTIGSKLVPRRAVPKFNSTPSIAR